MATNVPKKDIAILILLLAISIAITVYICTEISTYLLTPSLNATTLNNIISNMDNIV